MRALAAAATCGALLMAGCGEKDPPLTPFKNGYDAQRKVLTDTPGQVGDAVGDTFEKTTGELAQQLRGIENRYRARLGRLNELNPPKTKKRAFFAVTTGAQAVDADIARAYAATVGNDGPALRAAIERLFRDGEALRDAVAELNAQLGLQQQAQSSDSP